MSRIVFGVCGRKIIYNGGIMVDKQKVMQQIAGARVLPVAVINELSDTEPLLSALSEGGLKAIEITFRTACAADAIALSVKKYPDVLTGAGTVINAEQCHKAIDSGAKFIVGPGFSGTVAKVCADRGVVYLPGCVTPTEIIAALEYGIDVVKFFPAKEFGGLQAINALGAAFRQVKFVPTGGVDSTNLKEFLSNDKIFACGGSWMLKGSHDEIVRKVSAAVNIVKEVRTNG